MFFAPPRKTSLHANGLEAPPVIHFRLTNWNLASDAFNEVTTILGESLLPTTSQTASHQRMRHAKFCARAH